VPRPSPQSVYYLAYPVILAVGWVITWVNTRRTEAVKGDIARVNEQLREFYGPLQSISSATQAAYEAMIQQFLEQRPPSASKENEIWEGSPDSGEQLEDASKAVRPQGAEDALSAPNSMRAPNLKQAAPISDVVDVVPNLQAASAPMQISSVIGKAKRKEAVIREVRLRRDKQKELWHHALSVCARDGQSDAAKYYRLWATEVLQPLNEQALDILIKRADLMDTTTVPNVFRQFAAHVLAFRILLVKWNAGDFSQTRCCVTYPEAFSVYVGEEFRRLKLRQAEQLNTLHIVRRGGLLTWAGLGNVEMKDIVERQDIRSRL